MEVQYYKEYSPSLGRDMECKVYGHAGRPVLFIPCQDGRFFDFENFHMTDVWAPWIESGQVMICAIDTMVQQRRRPRMAHLALRTMDSVYYR